MSKQNKINFSHSLYVLTCIHSIGWVIYILSREKKKKDS